MGELGSGVGAFLAPPRKKMVKKTYLKKALGKGVSAEAETRASVLAEACMASAREPTRLVEECSVLAKGKASKKKVEGSSGERSVPSASIGR